MQRRTFTIAAAGALASGALLGLGRRTRAQEVTLKVAHFLPAAAPAHALFMEPWARQVEAESDGRISRPRKPCSIQSVQESNGESAAGLSRHLSPHQ